MKTTPHEHAIADLIRNARASLYKTAKDFWADYEETLAVSYSHYAAIESSKKFPDIELALRIARILKIAPRLICHVWAKDQMPDAATKAFFEPKPGAEVRGVPATLKHNLDDFYVFLDAQVPVLLERANLWETLMFIMAFSDSATNPTEAEVASALGLEPKDVHLNVEWLRNEGIVVSESGKLKAKKLFFHLPNTEAFKAVRDRNFQRTSKYLVEHITPQQLAEKTAYRTTYMRRLTEKQAAEISEHIDNMIATIGNLDSHGTSLYAITVGFGKRATFPKKASEKPTSKGKQKG